MTPAAAASQLAANLAAARAALDACAGLAEPLARAADLVRAALLGGGRLLTCGNGGSAADAMHLATEFVCRLRDDRPPYAALCLNASGGDLTAIGNDYAFADVFARQVQAFGRPGDVLVVLTSSGRSENVRRAIVAASERGMSTVAFLGRDGGATKGLATVDLLVPGTSAARIQEAHKLLLHTLCDLVEPALQGPGKP